MKQLILVLILLTAALLLNLAVENRLECSPSSSVAQSQPDQGAVIESAHLQKAEDSERAEYVRKLEDIK